MSEFVRLGILATLLVAGLSAPVRAQWSADPAANLVISDLPGRQSAPMIAPTADGGFHIAWQDASRSVRVQRLDVGGLERWPHNGVGIQQQAGWWSSAFTTDAKDNAVFATLSGGVAVVKVAPDGSLPWGAQGLAFPGSAAQSDVAVAATADGGLVGLWDEGRGLRLQKLDAAGAPQWGEGAAITLQAPFRARQPKLVAADDAGVIVTWVAENYPISASAFAQKFAIADGAALWGDGAPIALTGVFSNVMDFVLLADGEGGAVAAWVDGDIFDGWSLAVRAQHLDGTGAARLVQGGQPMFESPRNDVRHPAIAYDRPSGALHVVWAERPNNPVALYAQRLAADGTRVWGNDGKNLLSLDENVYVSNHFALPAPGGLLVAWADSAYAQPRTQQIRAVRLDAEGRHLFPGERVGLKGVSTPTQAIAGASSSAGYAAFVWGDRRSGVDNDDLLAQNLRFDGTLGNPDKPPGDPDDPIYADGFDGAPVSGGAALPRPGR